jgi:hypothetical protein
LWWRLLPTASVDAHGKEDLESSPIEQGFSRKLTVDGQKTIVTLLDIYQGHRKIPQQPNDDDTAIQTLLRYVGSLKKVLISDLRPPSDADGYILMYSTTSPYAFQDVVAHTRAVRRAKAAPALDPVLALVANQSDRPTQDQEVTRAEGEALARELDCAFAETSAKTGDGVDAVVADLVRVLRARKRQDARKQSSGLWGYFTLRR